MKTGELAVGKLANLAVPHLIITGWNVGKQLAKQIGQNDASCACFVFAVKQKNFSPDFTFARGFYLKAAKGLQPSRSFGRARLNIH